MTDEVTLAGLAEETFWYVSMRAWDGAGHLVESEVLEARTTGQVEHLMGRIQQDRTLESGRTYYVSSEFSVAPESTLSIGPDTVLKLNRGAKIAVEDPTSAVEIEASAGHPAIITSGADGQAGEALTGASGEPQTGDYAGLVLNENCSIDHARIRYAEIGADVHGPCPIQNSVFYGCGIGTRVGPSMSGVPSTGHTIKNALYVANRGDAAIEVTVSEDVILTTIIGYHNTPGILLGPDAHLNISNSIIARCGTGIQVDPDRSKIGSNTNNCFFANSTNISDPAGQSEDPEDPLLLTETPFWGEIYWNGTPTAQQCEWYYLLESRGNRCVDYGSKTAMSITNDPFLFPLDLTTQTAIGHYPDSHGRWADCDNVDLGWHLALQRDRDYLMHDGYIHSDFTWRAGWTICLEDGFGGLIPMSGAPETATLVIEPGAHIKVKTGTEFQTQALMQVGIQKGVEGQELVSGWEKRASTDLTEEEILSLPGLAVRGSNWGDGGTVKAKLESLTLAGASSLSASEPPGRENRGKLIALGSPSQPITFTHWQDPDPAHGAAIDGASPTWTPSPYDLWMGIGFTSGADWNSRIEYCDFFYSSIGVHVIQPLSKGVTHCRFFDNAIGVVEWSANNIQNSLFAGPGMGVWVTGYGPSLRSSVECCTFDGVVGGDAFIGCGVYMGGFLTAEEWLAVVRDSVFSQLKTGIRSKKLDLYKMTSCNAFKDVTTRFEVEGADESGLLPGSNTVVSGPLFDGNGTGLARWHLDQGAVGAVNADHNYPYTPLSCGAEEIGLGGTTTSLSDASDVLSLDLGYHYPKVTETSIPWGVGLTGWCDESGISLTWEWLEGERPSLNFVPRIRHSTAGFSVPASEYTYLVPVAESEYR